ncbi:MAG: hypothetical protein H6709_07860 [Kofleriaceae bacterium]|nr:hypothetical protein [Myxococcales bacterium]MCB9571994.1 hypothetical protein [Kofleriaceae bacterium]
MRRLAALLLAAAALVGAPRGAAAGAGEQALSGGLGIGTWSRPGEKEDETIGPDAGAVAQVVYERAFSEALSWRVEAAGAIYTGGGTSWGATAAAGLVYRFDVLKYVPYAVLELGGTALGGGPLDAAVVEPTLQIGGGLDVLRSRDASWGIEARLAGFAGDSTVMTLGVRVTRRWGYF